MIRKNEVFKIGMLGKPHGIHGEIQFNFTDDIFDRVDCDYIICMMDGILVPFFIEEYRFRSDVMALLKLEGVDTAEQAKRFTNIDVYFPIKEVEDVNEDYLTWDSFVGFEIIDSVHGMLGQVTEVEHSTVNTLFVVDYRGEELLIPAQEDLIENIDSEKRIICMNLPEGLVHLDDADSDED